MAELAASTAIDLDQVEALLRADAGARSIDEPVAGLEGEIGTLGDLRQIEERALTKLRQAN